MSCPYRIVHGARLLFWPMLVCSSVGAAGCDWKVTQGLGPDPVLRETLVVMQNQHGEVLGTRVFPASSTAIRLTVADAGGSALLSSKYIAVRREPVDGKMGDLVARTNTGTVSFPPPRDGTPVRAVFMATADLAEHVMDCFYGNYWGAGFRQVGRALPGVIQDDTVKVTVLDGDESILTDVIDDLDRALIDSPGVLLGQLEWDRQAGTGIKAGFSDPPALFYSGYGGYFGEVAPWYVLVNPHDSRGAQTMAAVRGFLCDEWCEENPCGRGIASYLVDPASNRLSSQGVSLLRFGAYVSGSDPYSW